MTKSGPFSELFTYEQSFWKRFTKNDSSQYMNGIAPIFQSHWSEHMSLRITFGWLLRQQHHLYRCAHNLQALCSGTVYYMHIQDTILWKMLNILDRTLLGTDCPMLLWKTLVEVTSSSMLECHKILIFPGKSIVVHGVQGLQPDVALKENFDP